MTSPCEGGCVLGVNEASVTIKTMDHHHKAPSLTNSGMMRQFQAQESSAQHQFVSTIGTRGAKLAGLGSLHGGKSRQLKQCASDFSCGVLCAVEGAGASMPALLQLSEVTQEV